VEGLPGGLGTWLGEQGLRLSGGERQRLAIARALLKDAPILVCDEPTSHLDPEAAQQVLDEIYRLSADRGVLVITHQLGGLAPMAEIVVLEAGAVAERGTFATLAARDGPFAAMLRLERDQLTEPA
jgi:ABC-type multidrug transport system fused ATPase/permease subunit